MFEVNNEDNRTTLLTSFWCLILNILHSFLVSILLTLSFIVSFHIRFIVYKCGVSWCIVNSRTVKNWKEHFMLLQVHSFLIAPPPPFLGNRLFKNDTWGEWVISFCLERERGGGSFAWGESWTWGRVLRGGHK